MVITREPRKSTNSFVAPKKKSSELSNDSEAMAKKARTLNSSHESTSGVLNSIPARKTEEGDLYICGNGDCAQLGKTDDVLDLPKPSPLKIEGEKFVDICCGGLHTLALTPKGELYSWGCNDENALGRAGDEFVPEKVIFDENVDIVQLAAGDSISSVLTAAGEIYIWGTFRNNNGLLGFVSHPGFKQATPVKLKVPGSKIRFSQITAGNNHILALSTKGRVYVVGANDFRQLGFRTPSRLSLPERGLNPLPLALGKITYVAAGGYHSFAVKKSGEVFGWGLNNFYQCGIPSESSKFSETLASPTLIANLTNLSPISKIAAGEHHSFILRDDSTLYGVGRSDSGQLGLGESIASSGTGGKSAAEYPEEIPASGPIDVESGSNHCLAILPEGISSWGYGESYALGHGRDKDEITPKVIESLRGKKILKASAGGHHSVFLVKAT